MGRVIILTIVLAVLWLLLSFYFDHVLLLCFGAFSVFLSVFLAIRAKVLDEDAVPSELMPGLFGYWIWLAREIGKSNIIVLRQALSLKPTLSPTMFTVPVPPKTNAGMAIYANSITLTPGTVSVDLQRDHILVHALTEDLADIPAIVDMGERVARLEKGATS